MTRTPMERRGAVAAALAALLLLAACGRSGAADQVMSPANYVQPPGWSSECFGRFVLDVPGEMELAEATSGFFESSGTPVRRYGAGKPASRFSGEVRLVGLTFTESVPMTRPQWLDEGIRQSDFQFTKGWRVESFAPREEKDLIAREIHKHEYASGAFVWRKQNEFSFGALIESDMRARLLHGKLSGKGSIAQAKAVVDTLWPRYRPRQRGEIPQGAGICTPYGFLADPSDASERDYAMDFTFPDPRSIWVKLSVSVQTFSEGTGWLNKQRTEYISPKDMPTPWEREARRAEEAKEKCRASQGTASRTRFGCLFAGLTDIKSHREVEYITLANGQLARLMVMENHQRLVGDAAYNVWLQAPGEPNSAERPWIDIELVGPKATRDGSGKPGKDAPSLDEAVATVRTIAASLRLRPGAVAPGVPVKDTLAGVR